MLKISDEIKRYMHINKDKLKRDRKQLKNNKEDQHIYLEWSENFMEFVIENSYKNDFLRTEMELLCINDFIWIKDKKKLKEKLLIEDFILFYSYGISYKLNYIDETIADVECNLEDYLCHKADDNLLSTVMDKVCRLLMEASINKDRMIFACKTANIDGEITAKIINNKGD